MAAEFEAKFQDEKEHWSTALSLEEERSASVAAEFEAKLQAEKEHWRTELSLEQERSAK